MAASSAEIEEFLSGPLVTWLSTCVKKPESLQVYDTFFDGSPISEVLLQIDPEPTQPVPTLANLQGLSIIASRIKIFHCIIKNIKEIYEEELGQVVVALPDCVQIGRAPASQQALQQLKLLILLLLGLAVQGPTKEVFISRIKELPLDSQHDIVECIKQVTDDQSVVLTLDWSEQSSQKLYSHLRTIMVERDVIFHHWVADLGQELPSSETNNQNFSNDGFESNHLAIELADWKARLRKQRQELEEKTELLTECREELQHTNTLISKLKTENVDLVAEARKAKAYRDEIDAMRDRAERVDRLEAEIQRYRERLADTDFYRVRVSELREDNRVLLETREMLESQLARARQRADHVLDLEGELFTAKQTINEITLEKDADREKIQELLEENLQLQQVTKSALQETSMLNMSIDSDLEESNSGDNSLSEQLTNNAQARALKLELENQKLLSTIDSLKEHSFHESSKKLLEIEKEKKKLELKLEQIMDNFERVKDQNRELDKLFKETIQENRKLQSSLDTSKVIADRQAQDLISERVRIEEFENNVDSLTKEKQRVHILCDTIKKRADDAEKALTQVTEQLTTTQVLAEKSKKYESQINNFNDKIVNLEKENNNLQKEVVKFKEIIETKEVLLDQNSEKVEKQEKEIIRLNKEHDCNNIQLEKLQECEQKTNELLSQAAIYTETITTLQKDLINEKVNYEKCKSSLEKVGLNIDVLDSDLNIIVEKMFLNTDLAKSLTNYMKERLTTTDVNCKKCEDIANNIKQTDEVILTIEAKWSEKNEKLSLDLLNLQATNEVLQNHNAKMQVNIATLTSQINSLQTQHTALQLANSQLVAEKEELSKHTEIQILQHDTLLEDQITLRTLHEQLSQEYDTLQKEQDNLKKTNRDMRLEQRLLKETCDSLEKKNVTLDQEKDALKNESKSLGNLRTEHSKLKDDFRNLFTANDRLKTEYRGLQDENKFLRAESSKLRLNNTEMQGEINSGTDLINGVKLDNAKLLQRCDILLEMNQCLDSDRRALMDHVSKLLTQYHSLLTHSLEDKEHYHLEEKVFTDKLNNLCRQKEKLEEKIMEHYRKLDNASSKKRGFGATLVRRVRKAGTDVINKIPRNRRSWHEDAQRLAQSQVTLGAGSGESVENDSDNSIDDISQEKFKRGGGSIHGKGRDEAGVRRSQMDLISQRNSISGDQISSPRDTSTPMSLGSVGTRRTVYLSEDDRPPTPTNTQAVPPMVIYNRISTVIGAVESQSTAPPNNSMDTSQDPSSERKKEGNAKENAIWSFNTNIVGVPIVKSNSTKKNCKNKPIWVQNGINRSRISLFLKIFH